MEWGMGYKTGYEMRAAAPLLGSLTLPRRCPRSDRGHLPHGAGGALAAAFATG